MKTELLGHDLLAFVRRSRLGLAGKVGESDPSKAKEMRLGRTNADDLVERNPDLFDSVAADASPSAAKPKKESPKLTRLRAGVYRFVSWTGIALTLVPIAAGGAVVGALAAWLEIAPPMGEFDSYDPPQATTILDRHNKPVSALFEERRFVLSLERMNPRLAEAFIAIEDERFHHHMGVDPLGIARAMAINAMRGRMAQGASTITQQTARNLLTHVGTQKTTSRKLNEMLASVVMEHRYSKDQIIEVYLNQIYLGSGTYGVQAASLAYFGKPASDLTVAECATLAGLPQAPERFSPLNNPEQTITRRNHVLYRMLATGVIDDAEYDEAVTTKLELNPKRVAPGRAGYFVDTVRRAISLHPNLGEDSLRSAGWQIRTTMDSNLQELAEQTMREGLDREEQRWLEGRAERYAEWLQEPEAGAAPQVGQYRMARVDRFFAKSLLVSLPGGWRADVQIPPASAHLFQQGVNLDVGWGVDLIVSEVDTRKGLFKARLLPQHRLQGALVCLDAHTGEVRAIVGGRSYTDAENNGFFNRAVQARRQAGSTFKPFFFAAGLEQGLSPSTVVSDTPLEFGDGYAPKNYDRRFMGGVNLQYSLEQSRNIPTFRVVQQVGLKRALEFVRPFQRTGDEEWLLPLEWPVVLGTIAVTPMELAAAYQPLANGGRAVGPRLVEGIWNDGQREAPLPDQVEPSQLMGPVESARLLQMMIGVVGHGTGKGVRERLPAELADRVAGKSGTTDDNRDAWFAGFTPWEVVVVWVGFDAPVPLAKDQTGGKSAGPIWGDFLARAWELKTPEERQRQWTLPDDLAFYQAGENRGVPVWRLIGKDQLIEPEPPRPDEDQFAPVTKGEILITPDMVEEDPAVEEAPVVAEDPLALAQ